MAKAKKLPSGSWRVQAKKNGITKSFTASTKSEAERQAAMWQFATTESTPDKMTFGEAVDKYISIKSNVLSPSTIRSYYNIKKNALLPLCDIPISRINNVTLQKTINEYSGSHSPKSVRNAYGLLTAVLKMYRPDFTPSVRLPQKNKVDIYIPTDEEIKKILSLSKNTPLETPLKLAIYGGLRAGEICALTPADIKDNVITINKSLVYDGNVWKIKPPKSFSGNRQVILPDNIELNIPKNAERITQYNSSSISIAYRKLLKRNNLPLHRFHDLRHFYISTLFDIGIPEKYIIAQVGHSSSSITKRIYDHISATRHRSYTDIITAHFSTL